LFSEQVPPVPVLSAELRLAQLARMGSARGGVLR
jgi:hypothetical protein